jgi:hypothetical protein
LQYLWPVVTFSYGQISFDIVILRWSYP